MIRRKIMALSGSTRRRSTNESILLAIAELHRDSLDVQIFKGLTELPHFNPDINEEEIPSSVKSFRALIDESDGVIICSPEYVFSVPGTLKNALEWTVSTTVFLDKPLALIVASGLGEKTFESLTLIMNTLGARIGEHSTLLIQGARSKFNPETKTLEPQTLFQLQQLMDSFLKTIAKSIQTHEGT